MTIPFEVSILTRILCGLGYVEKTGEEAKRLGAKNALIVTDKGIVKAGLIEGVTASLESSGIEVEIFDGVDPNPSDKTVERGVNILKDKAYDLLVAIGGGSSIDTAKAIGVMATNPGSFSEYYGVDQFPNPPLPLIAIPTTAGTGSEVGLASMIIDSSKKRKSFLKSPLMAPKVAILDAILTKSMPPKLTAQTGGDALSHAIESYGSLHANTLTDTLALKAINLISNNLRQAVANGENLEARYNMLLASSLAGIPMTNAGLGLDHALAHPLSSRFNVHHGLACSIMLPHVIKYNLIANPTKYARIAAALGEDIEGLSKVEAARKAVEAVKRLLSDIENPQSLGEIGLDRNLIPTLAEDAFADGNIGRNPRKTTKEELAGLYQEAW